MYINIYFLTDTGSGNGIKILIQEFCIKYPKYDNLTIYYLKKIKS